MLDGRVGPIYTKHYIDVIMTTMACQITSLTVVYSTFYSDADQRKHQSSPSLAFVWGIHRDRWIPRTKGQLRGKCFHLMTSSCVAHTTVDRPISASMFAKKWDFLGCIHICERVKSGTHKTKGLYSNIAKSRGREILCYNDRIALKFDRQVHVKFQSDWGGGGGGHFNSHTHVSFQSIHSTLLRRSFCLAFNVLNRIGMYTHIHWNWNVTDLTKISSLAVPEIVKYNLRFIQWWKCRPNDKNISVSGSVCLLVSFWTTLSWLCHSYLHRAHLNAPFVKGLSVKKVFLTSRQ